MKLLISACLMGQNCKYNGGNNRNDRVLRLAAGNEVITVCPEVMGGLPTPRVPSELRNGRVTAKDGKDVDDAFRAGARQCLEIARREQPDLIILQSRSPSCGVKQRYDGTFSGRLMDGPGVTAELLIQNGFRVVDVEDLENENKEENQMEQTGKLGFGLMRLPRRGLFIDVEQVKEMVDLFMEAGFSYFDTAYVYPGSEEAIRKALVERYPRESFQLATKLNAWMLVRNEKAAKQQFYTSLKRTKVGYFDYYLLHALMNINHKSYDRYHIWEYVRGLKEQGLIRHYGFSFHAGPDLLEQLLLEHPDVDFVQLQINYADWENPRIMGRANYEVAQKYGKPVIVMEPVKGGSLANPKRQVRELLTEANPDASFASWAIRYAASLEGVMTVLSGMSDTAQMKDNLSFMKEFRPLDVKEREVIRRAQEILGREVSIACTSCHYCTGGCPKQIMIPEIFHAMNQRLENGDSDAFRKEIAPIIQGGHGAELCIGCGQCEEACPQRLEVRDYLKQCVQWQ
ncbi:MAG: aldo/keto reductase [Eubacterium sp.]|jgi:predicted aldo/keto reductase-like oxidoreductase/uncharacterized protein YbbK (DUF523 family)